MIKKIVVIIVMSLASSAYSGFFSSSFDDDNYKLRCSFDKTHGFVIIDVDTKRRLAYYEKSNEDGSTNDAILFQNEGRGNQFLDTGRELIMETTKVIDYIVRVDKNSMAITRTVNSSALDYSSTVYGICELD